MYGINANELVYIKNPTCRVSKILFVFNVTMLQIDLICLNRLKCLNSVREFL